jgi:hypothetical protein
MSVGWSKRQYDRYLVGPAARRTEADAYAESGSCGASDEGSRRAGPDETDASTQSIAEVNQVIRLDEKDFIY